MTSAVTSGCAGNRPHWSAKYKRRAAVCVGAILIAFVNLDKLPLQHPPFQFQHQPSELIYSLRIPLDAVANQ